MSLCQAPLEFVAFFTGDSPAVAAIFPPCPALLHHRNRKSKISPADCKSISAEEIPFLGIFKMRTSKALVICCWEESFPDA